MAIYHINQQTGSDSNPGTQGLPKQNAPAPSAGDSWLFERGSVYVTTAAINIGASSMLLSAYGSGAKPIIQQNTSTTVHAFTLNNVNNCVIENLDIYHPASNDGVGVRISQGSNHIIRGNDIHGSRYGIFLISNPANTTIDSNHIYSTGDDGIGTGQCNGGYCINNTVSAINPLYSSSADCINFADSAGFGSWVIANNWLHYEGPTKQALICGSSAAAHNFFVYNNHITTNVGGIHMRGTATVLNNWVTCSSGSDFGLQSNSGTSDQAQVYYGNLVVCEGAYSSTDAGDGVNAVRVVSDAGSSVTHAASFFNNTAVGKVYRGVFISSTVAAGTVEFRNTLLTETTGSPSIGFRVVPGATVNVVESNTAVYGFTLPSSGITLNNPITVDPDLSARYGPVNTQVRVNGIYVGGSTDVYGVPFTNPPPIGAVQNPFAPNTLINPALIANTGYEGTQKPELSEVSKRSPNKVEEN